MSRARLPVPPLRRFPVRCKYIENCLAGQDTGRAKSGFSDKSVPCVITKNYTARREHRSNSKKPPYCHREKRSPATKRSPAWGGWNCFSPQGCDRNDTKQGSFLAVRSSRRDLTIEREDCFGEVNFAQIARSDTCVGNVDFREPRRQNRRLSGNSCLRDRQNSV